MTNINALSTNELVELIEKISIELQYRLKYQPKNVTPKVEPKIEAPQANEARKQVIEHAKMIISALQRSTGHYITTNSYVCDAEFLVNEKKRTVTVLLRGYVSGRIRAKGIAKCAPDDVFNVHIGKAIALHRAIGKTVSSTLLNSPKPDKVVSGMMVDYKGSVLRAVDMSEKFKINETAQIGSIHCKDGVIVEDTNAKY